MNKEYDLATYVYCNFLEKGLRQNKFSRKVLLKLALDDERSVWESLLSASLTWYIKAGIFIQLRSF